jgi:hypothetical protein
MMRVSQLGWCWGGCTAWREGYRAVIKREDGYFDVGNTPYYRKEDDLIDSTGLCSHVLEKPLDIVEDLKLVIDRIGDSDMKLIQYWLVLGFGAFQVEWLELLLGRLL